ncbi:MAG TPA: hypothetical protein ENF42_00385 [Candidatus Bathyarchaeota archaeon]|nr:hypothetical protein [Candidatus Bathyarchaeota archaeon]
MRVVVKRDRQEIVLENISTQPVAEQLSKDMNELLLSKDTKMYFFFEGGPGPSGGGMIIRIRLSRRLNDTDIMALRKFFSVRNAEVVIE